MLIVATSVEGNSCDHKSCVTSLWRQEDVVVGSASTTFTHKNSDVYLSEKMEIMFQLAILVLGLLHLSWE